MGLSFALLENFIFIKDDIIVFILIIGTARHLYRHKNCLNIYSYVSPFRCINISLRYTYMSINIMHNIHTDKS